MKTFIFIILSCLFSLAVNAQTTEINICREADIKTQRHGSFIVPQA